MERQLELSSALISYHLHRLEEKGEVTSETAGEYRRVFPRGKAPAASKRSRELAVILRSPAALRIALLLLSEGSLTNKAIAERLGLTKGTANHHLGKLVEAGVVRKVGRGEDRGFHLDNPGEIQVQEFLATFRPTPGMLQDFAELWKDLYGPG